MTMSSLAHMHMHTAAQIRPQSRIALALRMRMRTRNAAPRVAFCNWLSVHIFSKHPRDFFENMITRAIELEPPYACITIDREFETSS